MRLWAQILHILYRSIKVKAHLMSKGGVRGTFNYHHQQSLGMEFTPIQTIIFKDLCSTLVTQHVLNITILAIVVRGRTMTLVYVSQVCTVKMQKLFVLMPTVMVHSSTR